jgi:hypothetical protein
LHRNIYIGLVTKSDIFVIKLTFGEVQTGVCFVGGFAGFCVGFGWKKIFFFLFFQMILTPSLREDVKITVSARTARPETTPDLV